MHTYKFIPPQLTRILSWATFLICIVYHHCTSSLYTNAWTFTETFATSFSLIALSHALRYVHSHFFLWRRPLKNVYCMCRAQIIAGPPTSQFFPLNASHLTQSSLCAYGTCVQKCFVVRATNLHPNFTSSTWKTCIARTTGNDLHKWRKQGRRLQTVVLLCVPRISIKTLCFLHEERTTHMGSPFPLILSTASDEEL